MPIPDRLRIPIGHPRWEVMVTDDGSHTLVDRSGSVAFHSGCGAVSETRVVYLDGSGVPSRLSRQPLTSVLEIGVGLGLGLLMTADLAISHKAALRYVGVERDWLPAEVLATMQYDRHLQNEGLFDNWIDHRQLEARSSEDGNSAGVSIDLNPLVDVNLHLCEVLEYLERCRDSFDAIYFDPFDPSENSELWSPAIFRSLHDRLNKGGRMTTYCVKRSVRDAMTEAGFEVHRVAGPAGGKREVAIATRRCDSVSPSRTSSNFQSEVS